MDKNIFHSGRPPVNVKPFTLQEPLINPTSKDEILFHFILLKKVTISSSAFPILPHPILNPMITLIL
ncbi:MAG: hypothetical protein QXR45_16545 [Candidatus Bathyarchaeia archaeon]